MKRILIIVFLFCILFSCAEKGKPADYQSAIEESNFDVTELFQIDGCKIYRFYDAEYYHYFLIGDGTTINTKIIRDTGDEGGRESWNDSAPKQRR